MVHVVLHVGHIVHDEELQSNWLAIADTALRIQLIIRYPGDDLNQ